MWSFKETDSCIEISLVNKKCVLPRPTILWIEYYPFWHWLNITLQSNKGIINCNQRCTIFQLDVFGKLMPSNHAHLRLKNFNWSVCLWQDNPKKLLRHNVHWSMFAKHIDYIIICCILYLKLYKLYRWSPFSQFSQLFVRNNHYDIFCRGTTDTLYFGAHLIACSWVLYNWVAKEKLFARNFN